MGSALILPGAVDASPFGKFHEVEGTFDSTVALLDFGFSPLSGVPANLSTATNLMRDRAAAVSGLPAAQCDFEVSNTIGAGTNAAAEITSKGGLHLASTQAGAQTAEALIAYSLSPQFANWLLAQTDAGADYAVLMSLFVRCTRTFVGTPSSPQSLHHICSSLSSTANAFMHNSFTASGYRPLAADPSYLAGRKAVPNVVGSADLAYNTSQGWVGTKPPNLDGARCRRLAMLGTGDAWASFNYNVAGSYILYRAQLDIIDLSDVTGADRAAKANAMIAQLQAMATRDMNTAGGRFYADAYTPAATLKP